MGDLIVVYDPAKEIAAIVDTDERIGFGPAMIGPDAGAILDAFLLSIPYDVTQMSSHTLRDWFERFAETYFRETATASAATDTSAVVGDGAAGMANAALAEREASAAAGGPPDAAPHDADVEANTSEAGPVSADDVAELTGDGATSAPREQVPVVCYACSGSGTVPGAEDGTTVTCNLCAGTGRITVEAAA